MKSEPLFQGTGGARGVGGLGAGALLLCKTCIGGKGEGGEEERGKKKKREKMSEDGGGRRNEPP